MTEHWNRDEIFGKVAQVLSSSFEIEVSEIRLDSHVVDDLDLDSIDAIDLAVGLRELTGLDLSEEELKSIRIVQDIVEILGRKLPSS